MLEATQSSCGWPSPAALQARLKGLWWQMSLPMAWSWAGSSKVSPNPNRFTVPRLVLKTREAGALTLPAQGVRAGNACPRHTSASETALGSPPCQDTPPATVSAASKGLRAPGGAAVAPHLPLLLQSRALSLSTCRRRTVGGRKALKADESEKSFIM